ncbi:MAG: PEP-CTERM sorting domain-containing protein [Phycisphaerae bacterium]|nr:PEP-CTERM sorting domain-containing protein [Phycisphaerae bacterium]
MKKRKLKINRAVQIFAAVVLLGVILTSTASATILGTANIQNHNNSLSDQGQLWGGGLNGGTYYTGIYSWTNMGGTGLLGALVPNWGFCIELTQGAYNGTVDILPLEEAPLPVQYGTPMGTKADYIRELWGRHFDPNWVTNPTTTNKRLAEAFGAAVWEIVYETNTGATAWDVTTKPTGTGFRATIEQAATANTWLDGLNGDEDYFDLNLVATSTIYGQDYLVRLPTPPLPIPEPATIAILGLGALSLIRRKK